MSSDVETPSAPVEEVSAQETPTPIAEEQPIVERVKSALTPPAIPNPGPWSAIKSSPEFANLSDDQKASKLNDWTEAQMNFAKKSGQFDADTYKSIREFSAAQRADLGPSGVQHVFQLAKQLGSAAADIGASLVGNAFGLTQVGQELGQSDQPYSEALGIKGRIFAENAEAAVTGNKYLGGQNATISNSIDDLKKKIDDGELDADSIKSAAETITTANAQRFGYDPATLKAIPEFNPASTRNLSMLKKYADTGDPIYFDQFKRWVTANPAEAPAHAEVDRLLGGQDAWKDSVQSLTNSKELGDLSSVAQQGATDPVGVSLVPLAALGGTAGKMINGVAGAAIMGSGLEALNPNATTKDILEAGAKQAILPTAIHGIKALANLRTQKATYDSDAADPNSPTQATSKAASEAIQLQIADREKQLALPAPTVQPGEAGFVLVGEAGNIIRDERPASVIGEQQSEIDKINKTFPPAQRFHEETQTSPNVSTVAPEPTPESGAKTQETPVTKNTVSASPTEQIGNAGGATEGEVNVDPLQAAKDKAAGGLWDIGVHKEISATLGEELENAKTPEEVAAVKEKIDAQPKDARNGYQDLDPLTKTVVDEARKGNDVTELPLENQRQAAEFLGKSGETEAIKKISPNAASGKEISFRQLSPEHTAEVADLEAKASPEDSAKVQDKLAAAESVFGPEAADRLKASLKNPDDADQILAAARAKYHRQLLENPDKDLSPTLVRDSILRDYFDKVKAREDIQKESLQTPVGEEGTTKGDLTKAGQPTSTATPEEQSQIAQSALDKAGLSPEEKELVGRGAMSEEEAAKYAQSKGIPVTTVQAQHTLAFQKLANALRPEIESGKITVDDAKDALGSIAAKGLPEVGGNAVAAKPPSVPRVLKPSSTPRMTPEENGADIRAWQAPFDKLDPDIAQPFLKGMPFYRRAGITANEVHIIKDGKWDTGEPIDPKAHPAALDAAAWIQRDNDGTPHLIINADQIANVKAEHIPGGQLGEFDAWLNQVAMKHEPLHAGVGDYIQKWGFDNGHKDYGSAENAFTQLIKPELQSLKIKGTNLWDLVDTIYGRKDLPDTLKMHEATRMLMELRADGNITEQLGRPQYANGLRRLLTHMWNWFKQMPESPYSNSLINHVEQLLKIKPISELPLSDVESDLHSPMEVYPKAAPEAGAGAGAVPPQIPSVISPKPPEVNPLGKLSEEISKLPEVQKEDSLGQKIEKANELGMQNPQGNKIANGIMSGVKAVRDEMGEAPKYGNAERAIGETDWAIGDHNRKVIEFSKDISSKYSANGKKGISYYNIFGQDPDAIKGALSQMDEKNPNRAGLEAALKLTAQDKEIAGHVKDFYDDWGNTLVDKGAIGSMIEDYAQNMKWVKDPTEVTQLLGEVQSGKWRTDSNYFKKRILNPQAEIIKGSQLGNSDIAEAVKDYSTSASRALFTREAIGKTLGTKEADGRPTVAPYSARNITDLSGYRIVQHPSMRGYKIPAIDANGNAFIEDGPLAVHPDAYDKINNWLNSTSPIQKNAIGKAVLAVNSGIKEIRYASPIYHTATEALHSAIHGVNPFGVKDIDYNDPKNIDKMQHGLMIQPQSFDWNTSEGVGAYKGQVLPKIAQYAGKVPVVGGGVAWAANKVAGMQRWLFEKYIPSLMNQAYDNVLARNAKWYPELAQDDLKYLTAKQINSGFLGPNTNMLGRSPLMRDSLRLAIGAPAFNEGRLRFLGGALTKYGAENRRALGILGVASYVAARAFNQWYNGDSYTNKPFSFIANGKEVKFRHVLGDALELTSSAIPMIQSVLPKGTLAPIAKAAPFLNDASGTANYAKNRLSPIATAVGGPTLGLTDYRGRPVGVKDALMNLATSTLPLGASQAVQSQLPKQLRSSGYSPKSWEDDLMTGLGVNSKDYGAYQAMYDKGSNFAQAEGKPREQGAPSDYSDLKWELRHGDDEGAKKELESLLQDHSYGKIVKSLKASVKAPFTGSSELEPQFVQSLNPYEKNLYNEAMTVRRNTLIRLQQIGNKMNLNNSSGYQAMPKGQRQAIINQELNNK